MIQSRTTLSEMSKALNLSISTVSKSLSDSSEISCPTKKRVQEFAKACNYIPNSIAAGFRRGYTNTIGLVIPNIMNPFYANVMSSIEKQLDEKGYKLITSLSNESMYKETNSLKKMASGYIDGLIICPSKEAELKNEYTHIESLLKQGTPVVVFDRICEGIQCDKVIIDDYKTSFRTTELLIKQKSCKNVLMVSLIGSLHHGKLRANGFKDAAKKYDIKSSNLVADCIVELRKKLITILDKDITIDGIFGATEQAVIQVTHAMRDLKDRGLKREFALAGFCNETQSVYNPSLIVVNQKADKIGMETVNLILDRIRNTEDKQYFTKTIGAKFNLLN